MQSIEKLIAVVIPAFNCEKYLREAVESVLKQKEGTFEIVIIDDGSKDGTIRIADELSKEYENVFTIHQENKGLPGARNAGIKFFQKRYNGHMKNCYFAFLDADDMWTHDFFGKDMYQVLGKDFDIIGFKSAKCNKEATKREIIGNIKEGEYRGGE